MKFALVTTFHKEGYEKYGKRMMETLAKHLPEEISLTAYYENMEAPQHDRWTCIDFNEVCGDRYNTFKEKAAPYEHSVLVEGKDPRPGRGMITKGSKYLFEATRFSHKYFAVDHFWKNNDATHIAWCDADVVADKDLPMEFFTEPLLTEGKYWSRIGRSKGINIRYPECGFMIWDVRSEHHERYKQLMTWMYDDLACFQMEEWHDSFLWWMAERYIEDEVGHSISWDIGNGSGKHPFVRGVLGEYFDHLKGNRKDDGYSPEREVSDDWERKLTGEVG